MIRKLGYYCLVVMTVICVIRLTYKDQTLPTKNINNFTPTIANASTQPINSTPYVESIVTTKSISTNYSSNDTTISIDSNVPLTENQPFSCVTPTKLKLIKETSLDQLKAQGWHLTDYKLNSLEADFDNNGLKDKALYMVKDDADSYGEKEQGIFIVLTQKQSAPKIFYMSKGEGCMDQGIYIRKSKVIEVYDCKLNLQYPAIEFSRYQSWGVETIYWDKEQSRFLSIYTGF